MLQQPHPSTTPPPQSNETLNNFQPHRTNGNGSLLYNTLTNCNSNNITGSSHCNRAQSSSISSMNNNLNLILNANTKPVLFNTSGSSDYVTESCKDAGSINNRSNAIVGSVVGVASGGSGGSKSSTGHNKDKTWL